MTIDLARVLNIVAAGAVDREFEYIFEARNLHFSDVRHFCDKSNFLRSFWRIRAVEKVASDRAQLFRRGFAAVLYVDSFSSRL